MGEQEAIGLLEQLARDFNVRDPRKLFQIARREFSDRRLDECAGRGGPARRRGPAGAGAQAKEPGEERGGGAQRPAASGPGGDHSGFGPGGGQLCCYHRHGKRVPGPRGRPARRRGAPAEGPLGPQCNGGRR